MPSFEPDRLLGWSDVKALTGLSRTTVHRLRTAGLFPEPVVVSPGRVAWPSAKLAGWMNSCRTRAELATSRENSAGRGRARRQRAALERPPTSPRVASDDPDTQLALFE